MRTATPPTRLSAPAGVAATAAPSAKSPTTSKPRGGTHAKALRAGDAGKKSSARDSQIARRAERLLDREIAFIANDDFVGRRDNTDAVSPFAAAIERGSDGSPQDLSAGLPSHLGQLCATPLLTPAQEQELFLRMNFCKYRANALRARLSRTKPDAAKVAEAEDYLRRAERLRNHLIQANTRLVMSIARKFADARNGFDDLLSQGVASLMHAVEKFDYGRGYRFSTYATCAVRRDLYRQVMGLKRDQQRFATGAGDFLGACPERDTDPDAITESAWNHLAGSVRTMLDRLDERERFIVSVRFGLEDGGRKSSYSRLGQRLGISKERVRQLANRALEKMREWATEHQLEALVA